MCSIALLKSNVAQLACANKGVKEKEVAGEMTLTSNRTRVLYERDLRNAYPPQPVPSTTRRFFCAGLGCEGVVDAYLLTLKLEELILVTLPNVG